MRGLTTKSGILLNGRNSTLRTLHRSAWVALGYLHEEQRKKSWGEGTRTYRLTEPLPSFGTHSKGRFPGRAPPQGGKPPRSLPARLRTADLRYGII